MELVPLSDGARLATWSTSGADDGPPVVLLHGGPGLWDYLEPLERVLAVRRTVHRYDQRDCGRSLPGAVTEQSFARSIADLDELRRRWHADQVVLVGHSFGAALALAYAAAHPDRMAGVVHLSGVGIGDWRTPLRAELRRRQAPYAARLAELDAKDRTWPEEVEWRRLKWASDYADPASGLDLATPMAETPLPVNYVANRSLMTFTDADTLTWAAAITSPVLILHGAQDPRPAANATALAAHLDDARTVILDGAGHVPWVERPTDVRSHVGEFLTQT